MLSILPTSDGFRVLQIRFSGIPKFSLEINLRRQVEQEPFWHIFDDFSMFCEAPPYALKYHVTWQKKRRKRWFNLP